MIKLLFIIILIMDLITIILSAINLKRMRGDTNADSN